MKFLDHTLLDSVYCKVCYNGSENIMYILWKISTNKMLEREFKNHVMDFASFVQKYQIENIFVDTTFCYFVIGTHIQKWHDEVIIPKYLDGGLKKMAFLAAEDLYSQVSHEQTFEEEKSLALQVNFFDQEQKAKQWLLAESDIKAF